MSKPPSKHEIHAHADTLVNRIEKFENDKRLVQRIEKVESDIKLIFQKLTKMETHNSPQSRGKDKTTPGRLPKFVVVTGSNRCS